MWDTTGQLFLVSTWELRNKKHKRTARLEVIDFFFSFSKHKRMGVAFPDF
jgi:hypothetical protein